MVTVWRAVRSMKKGGGRAASCGGKAHPSQARTEVRHENS